MDCPIKKYWKLNVILLIIAVFVPSALAADIPGDITEPYGQVDEADLMMLAEWWMVSLCNLFDNCFGADMSGPQGVPDGIVNLHDFAVLAAHWLEEVDAQP